MFFSYELEAMEFCLMIKLKKDVMHNCYCFFVSSFDDFCFDPLLSLILLF